MNAVFFTDRRLTVYIRKHDELKDPTVKYVDNQLAAQQGYYHHRPQYLEISNRLRSRNLVVYLSAAVVSS